MIALVIIMSGFAVAAGVLVAKAQEGREPKETGVTHEWWDAR